jgi:hypothetical protein
MSWKGLFAWLAYRNDRQFGVREPDAGSHCRNCLWPVCVTELTVAVHHGVGVYGTCFGYEQPDKKPAYETTIPFWYCAKCDSEVPSMNLRTCVHTLPHFDARRIAA